MSTHLTEAQSRQAVLTDRAQGEVLLRVLDLHAPVEQNNYANEWWVVCDGCGDGAHAEGRPAWPCPTIRLVAAELHVVLPWAP